MNAMFKNPAGQPLPAFTPGEDEQRPLLPGIRLGGKHKSIEPRHAIKMLWPATDKERAVAFKTWRDVAMQVIHLEGVGFRLMAIVDDMIDLRTGTVSGTNLESAASGGGCSIKTISRDVGTHERLGLFIGTRSRKKTPKGEFVEHRTLRLALPAVLDPRIELRSEDNRGPA